MKRILMFCLLLSAMGYSQKPVFANAAVKAATVYFNGAELTQTASLNLPAGATEVVLSNVADYVDESSVRIGAPESATILSVQFTRDYLSEAEPAADTPRLAKVRDSIAILRKEVLKLSTTRATETMTLELLDKTNRMYGQQTGLSVAELTKMVEYYKVKRNESALAIDALVAREQKINERIALLQQKLDASPAPVAQRTSRGKLVLQVMTSVAGIVPLEITYMTQNASWQPFYDLRAESTATPISLMYKAQVVQQTGIDWKKVKLTLSSGVPSQNNQAPLLQAWMLRYGVAMPYSNNNVVYNKLQGRSPGLEVQSASVYKEESVDKYTTVTENQLSISFDIDLPYDILSNGKTHSVSMKELQLPATYKHYTVPKMETAAFLMAELNDYSKFNLLPGEANIIFENMYIGKTYIDPNQTTDTLNLSMGRDRRISVKREKVAEKSGTKFLSATREQTFTYDITLRNNKKDAVHLMVKDQYPISTDKEVEVELLQSDKAKVNAETGILTWEVDLKPGETKKIRLSYRVKHPKDKVMANL